MRFSASQFIGAAIALAMVQSPGHAAKKTLQLAPTTKWVLNYADDSCRLGRRFGDGKETVMVLLDRFAPGNAFKLTFAGNPVKLRQAATKRVTLQFGPEEPERQASFFVGTLGKDSSGRKRPALIMQGAISFRSPVNQKGKRKFSTRLLPKYDEKKYAAAITSLRIGSPLRKHVILETGSMAKPIAALNKCIDELLTHWGIDVEKHKNLTRRAWPANNLKKWVVADDYPPKMLSKGQQGTVNFRLSVDANGAPSACHIQLSTRPKEFDDAVCKALMKRAKFTPALDANGVAIASFFRNTVNFLIPH